MLQLKTWIQFKLRVRVKHALARPRTPSHPLSPPRPKTPRPLPAVRPPGGLPTVHPISDPYPPQIKVRACFTLGVKHALTFICGGKGLKWGVQWVGPQGVSQPREGVGFWV